MFRFARKKTFTFKAAGRFKPLFIALCVLVAAAAVVAGVFGFNRAYDFAGGYEFAARIEADLKNPGVFSSYRDNLKEITEKLENEGEDNIPYNFKVVKTYLYEEESNLYIVLRVGYTGLTESELASTTVSDNTVLRNLQARIDEKYPPAAVTVRVKLKSYAAPASFWRNFLPAAAAVFALGLLGAFYTAVRHDYVKGLVFLIITVFNAAVLFALAALLRLPVGGMFLAQGGASLLTGAILLFTLFAALSEAEKSDSHKSLSDEEIIDLAFNRNLKRALPAVAVGAVMTVTMGVWGAEGVVFALPVLTGLFAAAFVSLVVASGLYRALLGRNLSVGALKAFFSRGKKRAPKKKRDVPARTPEKGAERGGI